MLFFRFEHTKAPISALSAPLMEMGRHQSSGKMMHIKPQGEDLHYFGHTDLKMMGVLRVELQNRGVPFTEVEESGLPADKRELIAALRATGQLG